MKKLGFYKYAPAILENWDEFCFWDCEEIIGVANKPELYFKWSFGKYSGYGEIYYYTDTKKVRNTFGDNDSIMEITEPSMEEVLGEGIKHYSPLYNEPGLEAVFNKILDCYFSEQKK